MTPISPDNPAVQAFLVHSAILALKMFALTVFTIANRIFIRRVFSNPEDAKLFRGVVKYDDVGVERIRRAHLNDLENIPPFWILGAMYLTTGPSVLCATMLFRAFTLCRVMHSIVYAVYPLPQPTRAIAFAIPFLINIYMAAQTALYYITSI